jgi:prepilin-type N-terminal cleavage/methylation domain
VQQKQDIKGFTILELLVVITIVAIVSAVGYPNFMEWSEDRKVRKASEQIASMLTNINTQLQRGNFQYVQFQILPKGNSTTIKTKGIYQDTYSTKINSGGIQCSNDDSYWDETVQEIVIDTQIHNDKEGAVCFSKDGTKFLQTGSLQNQFRIKINGEDQKDYVVVCGKSNSCDVSGTLVKPSYLVLWSRFGTITKYKRGKSDWTIR